MKPSYLSFCLVKLDVLFEFWCDSIGLFSIILIRAIVDRRDAKSVGVNGSIKAE